jgi:peptide deformylase
MLKSVITWPNRNLTKKSAAVTAFDDELKQNLTDIVDTCRVMFGAGLAAPQIGIHKRIVAIKPSDFKIENPFPSSYNSEYMIMINPVLELSGEKIKWKEACLSVPGVQGEVERYEKCKVVFLDEDGNTQTYDAPWPFSGGLQHEIDHLDGVLYLKRMEKRKLRGLMFSLQRIKRKEKIAARKRRREQNK